MLESFVFERLQIENNDEVIKQLNKILKMMAVAVEFEDADEFTRLDLLFHESMITAIHHQYIEMIWHNLTPVMECLVLISMRKECRMNLKILKESFITIKYILKRLKIKTEIK